MSSSEEESDSSFDESDFDEDFSDDGEAVNQAILGFPLQLPANMTWTSTQFEQEIDPFLLQCGPNAPQQRSPLEYFQLFFDNEIIEQLIGDFPTTHANSNKRRRSSNDYPQRMFGVGEHIAIYNTLQFLC